MHMLSKCLYKLKQKGIGGAISEVLGLSPKFINYIYQQKRCMPHLIIKNGIFNQ